MLQGAAGPLDFTRGGLDSSVALRLVFQATEEHHSSTGGRVAFQIPFLTSSTLSTSCTLSNFSQVSRIPQA